MSFTAMTDSPGCLYRHLAASLPHTAVLVTDLELRLVLVEGAGLVRAGYHPPDMEGRLLSEVVPAEVFAEIAPHYRAATAGGTSEFVSISHRTGRTFRTRTHPLRSGDGTVIGALALAEDVTAEFEAQAALVEAQAFRDAILTAFPDITLITEADGAVSWTSRPIGEALGWPAERPPPSRLEDLVADDDVDLLAAADLAVGALPDAGSLSTRFRLCTGDGGVRWMSRRSTPFTRTEDGAVRQVLSVLRDVTDVVEAEELLRHAALHDPLTGLGNRTLLFQRIDAATGRAADSGGETVVLFCDLDAFKRINDSDGHAAGDAVLIEVARRLRSVVRAEDCIARVGGDEFVVVLEVPRVVGTGPSGAQLGRRLAERIQGVLIDPVLHGGHRYQVSASIGMTVAGPDSAPQDLLQAADADMYRSKRQSGHGSVGPGDDPGIASPSGAVDPAPPSAPAQAAPVAASA